MEEEAHRDRLDHGQQQVGGRQTLLLDRGWLFHLGDIDSPVPNTHLAAYMANKAGYARGAAGRNYDDSDWRPLDLPHDWAVEQPVSESAHLSGGYRPRGVAWYRRHFRLEETDRGRRLTIRFDGVATHCTVWGNGHLLHRNWCGYTGFTIDITDVASFGDELNVIAVRVDATYMEGWWYEGAGIYRHVWLTTTHALHLDEQELFVIPILGPDDNWTLRVQSLVRNQLSREARFDLRYRLFDPDGLLVAEVESDDWSDAIWTSKTYDVFEGIKSPNRWSLEKPQQYRLVTRVLLDGELTDELSTPFGFRTIRWDANAGFFLNDQPVRLLGTCNHQDHAGVGVAVPDSIDEFRIHRPKDMGCNAIRCAHNPPAPEFLDACDRLGMLVIDETRNFGSSPEHLAQLAAMVKRDRNHPSVIAWSICNEEAVQGTGTGAAIARTMAATVRELDPTRPVTGAVSGGLLGEHCIADALDVIGINYQLPIYDAAHAKYPEKAIYAAETHCVCATRGEHATDAAKHTIAADDSYAAPWGASAQQTWRTLGDKSFVAGIFIWTGFDYRGEPTPHTWPCVNSFFGQLDTCGFRKDGSYLHNAYWTREPFVHLLPHWNAPTDRVIAYSNCDEVELWLNGRSLGRRVIDPIEMASWPVTYEPGDVLAVGFRGGAEVARAAIATTGPATALGLEIDPAMSRPLRGDGEDALPVTVFAVDASGRRVPTANEFVTFAVSGPAGIVGVGNGDPTCHEPDKASARSLFNGLAQLILQSTGEAGEVVVIASANGLAPATLRIPVLAAPPRPAVPVTTRRWLISDWRVSPRAAEAAPISAAAQDMNSWDRIKLTHAHLGIPAGEAGSITYLAKLKLPKRLQSRGARLVLHGVSGEVEMFLAGKPITSCQLPPISSDGAELAIRLRARDQGAGLTGQVELVADDPA